MWLYIVLMKPKPLTKEQVFFVSNSLTYKRRTELFVNEHVRLESTVTELIFLSKIILSVVL